MHEHKSGSASAYVKEHRHAEHHMVGQHMLGGKEIHGKGLHGSGMVPPTPSQDKAGEPNPSHPPEQTMEK